MNERSRYQQGVRLAAAAGVSYTTARRWLDGERCLGITNRLLGPIAARLRIEQAATPSIEPPATESAPAAAAGGSR